MNYLRHIQQCNQYRAENFVPFILDGLVVGEVRHSFADQLPALSETLRRDAAGLVWEPAAASFEERNRAMDDLTGVLLEAGLLPRRRGELYPVTTGQRDQPLFLMDRAVVPYFGVRAFGQHMNGYLERDGEVYLWIARRAWDRSYAPGKLDNLVAGGLPWGLSLEQNLAKECWEEAAIGPELAAQALPVGHISYRQETAQGLKPDVMYCYDLELPDGFKPRCTDGEVQAFELLPLGEVARLVQETEDFKLNCNLVIIDFMIRHGYISPRHPEYRDLVRGLRSPVRD